MDRRQFVVTGLGLHITSAIALASQGAAVPHRPNRGAVEGPPVVLARPAKATRLFKSPGLYPNALAVLTDPPRGLWVGQQKNTPPIGPVLKPPGEPRRDEARWLIDLE